MPDKMQLYIKIAGWLLGVVGPLVTFCGLAIGYVYRNDKKQNTKDHSDTTKKIDDNKKETDKKIDDIDDKTDSNSERISKIEGALDI